MKTLVLISSLLFLAVACDNPQRTRTGVIGNGYNAGDMGNPPGWDNGFTTSGTQGGTTGSGNNNNNNLPPGFENCDLTPKPGSYAAGIGYLGICQSTTDETSVVVKPSLSDSARLCLIPTYKSADGSSAYIGQPQCFIPQANVVTTGKLYKTRPGFTHSPLNGVMVMKETSLGAYFTCMDAYVSYTVPPCIYGPKTSTYCHNMATARMTQLCNDFKAMNSYIDIRLK